MGGDHRGFSKCEVGCVAVRDDLNEEGSEPEQGRAGADLGRCSALDST